jgi:hypothetical protein
LIAIGLAALCISGNPIQLFAFTFATVLIFEKRIPDIELMGAALYGRYPIGRNTA